MLLKSDVHVNHRRGQRGFKSVSNPRQAIGYQWGNSRIDDWGRHIYEHQRLTFEMGCVEGEHFQKPGVRIVIEHDRGSLISVDCLSRDYETGEECDCVYLKGHRWMTLEGRRQLGYE